MSVETEMIEKVKDRAGGRKAGDEPVPHPVVSGSGESGGVPGTGPGADRRTIGSRGWIWRLAGYLLNHRRNMVLALTGALLGSACQTLVPLIARQIVDGVILRRDSPLWPWLTLLVAVAVASFGFTYLRRYRGG
ncbi:MAG: hypothetical protein ACRDQH_12365, partial [Pseudonocardiaceae bacterium]